MFTSCHMQEDRNMISSNIKTYQDDGGGGLMIFTLLKRGNVDSRIYSNFRRYHHATSN